MDPVSNADRFVAALRQKLAERSQVRQAKSPRGEAPGVERTKLDAVKSVTSGAARAGLDSRKLRRAIVEQLLADKFGVKLVNEARFQEVVSQVTEIMEDDPEIGALLNEVMAAVRK